MSDSQDKQMDERSAKFELDRACLLTLRRLGLEMRQFFDVGASDGAWSRHICRDFNDASFDLFEPLLDHVPGLRLEIESGIKCRQLRVHGLALGPQSKTATMYLYPDNLRGSTALELSATPKGARPVQVPMLTMEDAVKKLQLQVPDVVKMDTQGCELGILQGASSFLPEVKVLFLECWLVRGYGKNTPLLLEVAEFLRAYDFHFWDFTGQWRDSDDTLGAQDCVFLNARCKVSRLQEEPRQWGSSAPSSEPAGWLNRWLRPKNSAG